MALTRRNLWLSVSALLIGGIAVSRLWGLAAYSLDGDEIFGVLAVRFGWIHLFSEAIRDAIHPPLFYVLLRFWVMIGGESLFWVRLLSAVASILCVAPIWLLCRELDFAPAQRNAALALFAVNPLILFYSQHLRMYSLLMLLSLVSLWLFARLIRAPGEPARRLAGALLATNLALVYTHYYGWTVVGLELAITLLWLPQLRKKVVVAVTWIAAIFLPWAYLAVRSLQYKGGLETNIGWIPRPAVSDLAWFFVDLAGFTGRPRLTVWLMRGVLAGLAVVTLRAVLVPTRRGWSSFGKYHYLACFSFLPVLAAFAVSQVLPESVWGHRHLILAVVPFLMLCVLLTALPRFRVARVALLGLTGLWALYSVQGRDRVEHRKIQWDSMVREMLGREDRGADKVPLYAIGPYLHYPFWFYLDEWRAGRTGLMAAEAPPLPEALRLTGLAKRFQVFKIQGLEDIQPGVFWLAYSSEDWKETETPQEKLEHRGCSMGPEIEGRDRYRTVWLFPGECR